MLGPSEFLKIFCDIDVRAKRLPPSNSDGLGCVGKGVAVCAAAGILAAASFVFPRQCSSTSRQPDAAPTSPLPPKSTDTPE
jgi:hypothetical protein